MLLFFPADGYALDHVRIHGVQSSGGLTLWTSLYDAKAQGDGPVLVIEWDTPAPAPAPQVQVDAIPPEAIRNLDPYIEPEALVAGGGYVMRPGTDEPEVLLIFRRGVWDLPKGKQDKGETIEACALREVQEEVGIEQLETVLPLGTTVHDFMQRGRYRVKTTYWYLMHTPETHFTPQTEEDIEAVAWVPWMQARRQMGYTTLQAHMAQVEPLVLKLFGGPA